LEFKLIKHILNKDLCSVCFVKTITWHTVRMRILCGYIKKITATNTKTTTAVNCNKMQLAIFKGKPLNISI